MLLGWQLFSSVTAHQIILCWYNEYGEMPTLYLITELYLDACLYGRLLWACFSREIDLSSLSRDRGEDIWSTFLEPRVQEGEAYSLLHSVVNIAFPVTQEIMRASGALGQPLSDSKRIPSTLHLEPCVLALCFWNQPTPLSAILH